MNGTAPDLDDGDDCELSESLGGPILPHDGVRYQEAMCRILQWTTQFGGKLPTPDELRFAVRGLCATRACGTRGCFKWVAERMGIHRNTLRRVLYGETPMEVSHVLMAQAIIISDWIRLQGHEPRDIFGKNTDTALARTLREKVKGYVPPEEKPAEMSADQLQARWFQLANDFSDVKWPPEEDDARKFEFAKIADLLVNQIIFSGDNKVDASRFGKRTDELISRMEKKRQWREDAEFSQNG